MFSPAYTDFFDVITQINDPTTYEEAKDSSNWKTAMNQELKALEENHTWNIVQLFSG